MKTVKKNQGAGIRAALRNKGEVRANDLVSLCAKDLPSRMDSYLDVGMGLGYNTQAFSVFADSVIGLDLSIYNKALISEDNTTIIRGSGQKIPLKNCTINLITSISVIEHVPDKVALLSEIMRVLKPNGYLVLQFPNRYFFIELHSGIPFYFFFPKSLREFVAEKLGCKWLTEIDIPTIKTFRRLMRSVEPNAHVRVKKVVYSAELLMGKEKLIYQLLRKTGIFELVPMGYLLIISK
jgi:SAM-dependent methyltransferase